MTQVNVTTVVNWGKDSFDVVCAKQELNKFLKEKEEFKGKSTPKIDAYHDRRISELQSIILQS